MSGECPQCEKYGGAKSRLTKAEGRFFGYARCQRCGVVVKRAGKRWRLLTSKEWDIASLELAQIRITRESRKVVAVEPRR